MTLVHGSALTFDDPGIREYPYSLSALEFFRLFPQARDFRLSTGVRMSASFPYVCPAVNLPTVPARRVVDAGYYDNYGIEVAAAWVQRNRVWLNAHTSGVVLIQIRDSISQKDRLEVAGAPQGLVAWIARGLRFFTTPLGGAARARDATTMFRNDQDVWQLSELFDRDKPLHSESIGCDPRQLDRAFFTTVVFENAADVTFTGRAHGAWPGDEAVEGPSTDVPLNWYLSDAHKDGLIDAIPEPEPGTPWSRPECRRGRIEELARKVNETHGVKRDEWLKLLEQAENYERLVALQAWWTGATPDPCTAPAAAAPEHAPARKVAARAARCAVPGCPFAIES
jgi:hypothetical protein